MSKSQKFKLVSDFDATGDQPKAIKQLVEGIRNKEKIQTLLGVTGSGKTFTMAKIVEKIQRPTLVVAHNKTLAAQLCSEFQEFFPNNAVSYFVSYYDYYQPEAYIPKTDTYIEKDASINEEINKHRHAATVNLLTRKDVLIVASVSCIYGLGSEEYMKRTMKFKVGDMEPRDKILRKLTDIQYVRSNLEFKQGMFHVLGEVLEIFPPSSDNIFRLEFFGDEIEKIVEADSFTGEVIRELDEFEIFPAKHDITSDERIKAAVGGIEIELEERVAQLKSMGKPLDAHRLRTKTEYDLEILKETGYCSGIENYTRYLGGREAGTPPATLLDYFPDDFLMFVDESHMTIPQIGAMYNGNLSRKQTLIEHGFRMTSALDNRPLKFEEVEGYMKNIVCVSATPGKYELAKTLKKNIAEQIIRPTGLLDPVVEVRTTEGQMDDLMKEINATIKKKERVLITTLTKRLSEDLTDYLLDAGLKVKYLHSDIDTLERIEILRDLRLGEIDVLVGINLLREGLDLPEVSFIAILDADKEGFLRSVGALIQTIGRAARNVNGRVVMYADKITNSMRIALDETDRRRKIQKAYNKKHGITPKTIIKAIKELQMKSKKKKAEGSGKKWDMKKIPLEEVGNLIKSLEIQMDLASRNMEFEKAAEFRDQIEKIEKGDA